LRLGVWERLSSPSGSGLSPAAKRILVHFLRSRWAFYFSEVVPSLKKPKIPAFIIFLIQSQAKRAKKSRLISIIHRPLTIPSAA